MQWIIALLALWRTALEVALLLAVVTLPLWLIAGLAWWVAHR